MRKKEKQKSAKSASLRRHALFGQLLDRVLVLREVGEAHAAQHVGGLGELDVVVADDLDAVAPGIAEIEEAPGQRLDAGLGQRLADRFLVVDHQPEMTAVVGRLRAALLQRDELVAEIDER